MPGPAYVFTVPLSLMTMVERWAYFAILYCLVSKPEKFYHVLLVVAHSWVNLLVTILSVVLYSTTCNINCKSYRFV